MLKQQSVSLKSYKTAQRQLLPNTEHRSHKRLNNKIEVSHEPTRVREKVMRKFKSATQAQRFLSTFGVLRNTFKIGLYKLKAAARKLALQNAISLWNEATQQAYCA